ncbi:DsbA family protein [Rickettsiales bacterium]|nr:DsbA family protein [Rickettsiales bacterium]
MFLIRFFSLFVIIALTSDLAIANEEKSDNVPTPSKAEILTVRSDDIVIGSEDAPVTIFEYASLTCSHCAAFYNDTYQVLKKNYIDNGKVRLVYRDFPLDGAALRGAQLARCDKDKDPHKFLKVMYSTQSNWATKKNFLEILSNIGKLGGIKGEEFDACIADENLERSIMESKYHAISVLEVRSTPTFFINGQKHDGSRNFEYFKGVIDEILNSDNKAEKK